MRPKRRIRLGNHAGKSLRQWGAAVGMRGVHQIHRMHQATARQICPEQVHGSSGKIRIVRHDLPPRSLYSEYPPVAASATRSPLGVFTR